MNKKGKKTQLSFYKKTASSKSAIEQFALASFLAAELGFSLSIPIVLGAVLGWWIDKRLLTSPKITLSFIAGGVIISILQIVRIVKSFSSKN